MTRYDRLLKDMQRDVKWRYKGYKHGMQQGLPMVWDNMMESLRKEAVNSGIIK